MNQIELQEYVTRLAFGGLHPSNAHQVFELYEMMIEEFCYKHYQIVMDEIKKSMDDFVRIDDIGLGNANKFYISSTYSKED